MKSSISLIVTIILVIAVTMIWGIFQKNNSNQIKSVLRQENSNISTVEQASIAYDQLLTELPSQIPVMGNPEAKLVVIEFGDFQCPYCGKFFREILPEIKKNYIDTGKVKFVYLDLAFLGQESKDAAEAVHCAQEQDKFWEYHDQLYARQNGENLGAFRRTNLLKMAQTLNLGMNEFESCLDSDRHSATVEKSIELARKYGIRSTPSTIINTEVISGALPYASFAEVIERELSKQN